MSQAAVVEGCVVWRKVPQECLEIVKLFLCCFFFFLSLAQV